MMVLVDTTVWIDFFAARSSAHVGTLEDLIINREDICICGILLTEVLQGIRKDSEFKKTRDLFNNLLFLPMPNSVFF
jgi:predicted nucleic acid-binding protein